MPLRWDPLFGGLSDATAARPVRVEAKRSRDTMIACVGYSMPEVFRLPGSESSESGLRAFSPIRFEDLGQLSLLGGARQLIARQCRGG